MTSIMLMRSERPTICQATKQEWYMSGWLATVEAVISIFEHSNHFFGLLGCICLAHFQHTQHRDTQSFITVRPCSLSRLNKHLPHMINLFIRFPCDMYSSHSPKLFVIVQTIIIRPNSNKFEIFSKYSYSRSSYTTYFKQIM